ncbi:MAG: hypothetical protein V1886_00720 [archaeon]
MTSKKGVSHIEMVVSFMLFASFVFFLLFFLNPVRNQDISDVLLDAVQNSLQSNATIQLIEMPLNIKAGFENCFTIPNPFDTSNRANILAKDSNGRVSKTALDSGSLKIEKGASGQSYYYLYYGSVIFTIPELQMISCNVLNISNYKYAASRVYEVLYLPKLEGVARAYSSDYTKLRGSFNFPLSYDFSAEIIDSATKQKIISMSTSKPEKVEVNARELPAEIMRENGEVFQATINMQVW